MCGDAIVAIGLLPAVSVGYALGVDAYLTGRLRGLARVLVLADVPATPAYFSFGLAAAQLGACVDLVRTRAIALDGCAAAVAGAIHDAVHAQDRLVPEPTSQTFWLALAASVRFDARVVGPLRVELGLEAVVPIDNPRFLVHNAAPMPDTVAFQQTPVGGVGSLGLVLETW